MSVLVRKYKEMSRSYLLKILEKEKQNILTHPIIAFGNSISEDLKKSGFFDKYKDAVWWRQEICLNYNCIYHPIYDNANQ